MAESLLSVAIKRAGVVRGSQAIAFMVQWDVVRRELGREPHIEEYAEWWHMSRATAFREQQRFRKAFPTEATPSQLLDQAADEWDRRKGWRGLGAVKVAS